MAVRLVVVCTANICRSPLAAAMLAAEVRARGAAARVSVDSAGVHARHGDEAAGPSVAIARGLGLDLEEHRSRPVDDDLDDERTILLTLTEQHRDLLITVDGSIAPRCFTLRELARLVAGIDRSGLPAAADERVREVARRAHACRGAGRASSDRVGTSRGVIAAPDSAPGTTSTSAGPEDVADPYGRSDAHYAAMAATVGELIDALAPVLLGPR